RDDQRDGLADNLLGAVAEQSLCAAVPGRDASVERFTDDRVIGRFDDRRAQPSHVLGALLAFAQRALGAQLVGDIAREAAALYERAVLPANVRCDTHVANRTILASHLCRLVAQRFAVAQSAQNLGAGIRVSVELADVVA